MVHKITKKTKTDDPIIDYLTLIIENHNAILHLSNGNTIRILNNYTIATNDEYIEIYDTDNNKNMVIYKDSIISIIKEKI